MSQELVYISARVSVKNSSRGVVVGDVRVKTPILRILGVEEGVTRDLGGGWWGRGACDHPCQGNWRPSGGRGPKGGGANSM